MNPDKVAALNAGHSPIVEPGLDDLLASGVSEHRLRATTDAAQAVAWFRKAADQGDASAQFNLGVMYANGTGVGQDSIEAYTWISLATARSSEPPVA